MQDKDKDKYIPGVNREDPPIGLYKIIKTGGGAPKIKFDDPYGEGKKAEEPQTAEEKPAEDAAEPTSDGTQAEEKEIEFLRAERAVLEQMIQAAAGPLWEDDEEEEPLEDEEQQKKERRKPAIR